MKQEGQRRSKRVFMVIVVSSALFVVMSLYQIAYAQTAADAAASARAFVKASQVFFHPRCVNCHPAGDAPLQGDESRPHAMNVKRGPDGQGTKGVRCSNCHQTKNLPGAVLIKVGTFDDPSVFGGPQMVIFTIDKQSFHHVPEGVPSFERTPG